MSDIENSAMTNSKCKFKIVTAISIMVTTVSLYCGTFYLSNAGQLNGQADIFSITSHSCESLWGDIPMRNVNRDFRFSVPDLKSRRQSFRTTRLDPELLEIRQKLIDANLWDHPVVQRKYHLAKLGFDQTRQRILTELLELIEQFKRTSMVLDDPYMPYASASQISNGGRGIHILNQAYNEIPLFLDETTLLLRGMMVIGRPGYGKSSAVYHILNQVTVPYLGLDPKASWKPAGIELGSEYLDWDSLYFCLRPPLKLTWPHWLSVVSDLICQATGLQFSQDVLIEAGGICLEQKRKFEESTGTETSISLRDWKNSLSLCAAKNPKRMQYLESAKTALSLIVGPDDQHIFAARSGLPLDEIFRRRYFMGFEYANSYQARFLGPYVFTYQRYSVIGEESSDLRHFILADDAGRLVSQSTSIYGSGGKYGQWMNLLKVLRSSGEGYLFVDQLCAPILKEIKQLVNCWLVIGSIGGKEELDAIAAAVNLNADQKNMLTKLKQRECVFYCPEIGRPIHGFVPVVDRPC